MSISRKDLLLFWRAPLKKQISIDRNTLLDVEFKSRYVLVREVMDGNIQITQTEIDDGSRTVSGRTSAATRLLGSRVQIPLRAWMFFPCVCWLRASTTSSLLVTVTDFLFTSEKTGLKAFTWQLLSFAHHSGCCQHRRDWANDIGGGGGSTIPLFHFQRKVGFSFVLSLHQPNSLSENISVVLFAPHLLSSQKKLFLGKKFGGAFAPHPLHPRRYAHVSPRL